MGRPRRVTSDVDTETHFGQPSAQDFPRREQGRPEGSHGADDRLALKTLKTSSCGRSRRPPTSKFRAIPRSSWFAHVASNWLWWQFKGDEEADRMFAGDDCALCTNPNWDARSEGMD